MTRVVVQVRCHDVAQKLRWVAAAGGGRAFSSWVRRALDDRAALDAAIARQAAVEGAGEGGLAERDERLEGVAPRPVGSATSRSASPSPKRSTAGAMPGLCVHRVPLDAYCKLCV